MNTLFILLCILPSIWRNAYPYENEIIIENSGWLCLVILYASVSLFPMLHYIMSTTAPGGWAYILFIMIILTSDIGEMILHDF